MGYQTAQSFVHPFHDKVDNAVGFIGIYPVVQRQVDGFSGKVDRSWTGCVVPVQTVQATAKWMQRVVKPIAQFNMSVSRCLETSSPCQGEQWIANKYGTPLMRKGPNTPFDKQGIVK